MSRQNLAGDSNIPDATRGRTLRVTTWGGGYQEVYEGVASEFIKAHNSNIQWVVGSSLDHLVNSQLGRVDVTTNTLLNSIAGEKEGLWAELDASQAPNMANLYPTAVFSPLTVFANVGDNADKISEEPKSWDALWDLRCKGHVVILGFEHSST